jgi:hypothetical protein
MRPFCLFHLLPLLKEAPPELSEKIKDINDIEHLRKLALLLVSNERSTVRDFNGVLRSFCRVHDVVLDRRRGFIPNKSWVPHYILAGAAR